MHIRSMRKCNRTTGQTPVFKVMLISYTPELTDG
jgi:hypothetical protein